MYEIKVIEKGSGEIVKDIECIGFNIQYSKVEDNGRIYHLRNLLNAKYDFKYWVKNEFYTPIAQMLKDNIEEFKHIDPTKILFIEDIETEEDINKTPEWVFKISKTNKHLRILTGYSWIVESKECWVSKLSNGHIVAHIYNMMKYIDIDGNLKKEDIRGWKETIGSFGYGWEACIGELPNIFDAIKDMDEKQDFKMLRKANKQINVFELKSVK